MKVTTLQDAFIYGLADISNAEKQLLRAIPKLSRAARHEGLSVLLDAHCAETEEQVGRISQIIEHGDLKLPRAKSKVMEMLVEECNEIISHIRLSGVRDAMLIGLTQKIEYFQIASYRALIDMAKTLQNRLAVRLLSETLKQEEIACEKLSGLARSQIHAEALRDMSITIAA